MYKIIDVSKHNGKINWKALKGVIDGAIIRAGYSGLIDSEFTANIAACNMAGIPVGVYWFTYEHTVGGAVNDAREVLEAVKNYRLELPIFYDFEDDTERYCQQYFGVTFDGPEGRALRTEMIKAFCLEIEKAGYYAGYYSNKNYLINRLNKADLDRFDLWLAQWNNEKPSFPCGIIQRGTINIDGAIYDYNETERNYPDIIKKAGLNGFKKAPAIGDTVTVKLNAPINFKYETPLEVMAIKGDNYILGLDGSIIAVVNKDNID